MHMQISPLIAVQVGRDSEYYLILPVFNCGVLCFFFADETDIYRKEVLVLKLRCHHRVLKC